MKTSPHPGSQRKERETHQADVLAPPHPTLLLALGNDLLGDDAVGLVAARALREELSDSVDVLETSIAGYALLEILQGYQNVLLLDAICTGKYPPGTIHDCTTTDFRTLEAPSPHCVGLPDIIALAGKLEISFPSVIHVLAVEIPPPTTLHEGLSDTIWNVLPQYVERAREVLKDWTAEVRISP